MTATYNWNKENLPALFRALLPEDVAEKAIDSWEKTGKNIRPWSHTDTKSAGFLDVFPCGVENYTFPLNLWNHRSLVHNHQCPFFDIHDPHTWTALLPIDIPYPKNDYFVLGKGNSEHRSHDVFFQGDFLVWQKYQSEWAAISSVNVRSNTWYAIHKDDPHAKTMFKLFLSWDRKTPHTPLLFL